MGRGTVSKTIRKHNRGTLKLREFDLTTLAPTMCGLKIHSVSHEGYNYWVGYRVQSDSNHTFVDVEIISNGDNSQQDIGKTIFIDVSDPPLYRLLNHKFKVQFNLGMVDHLESRILGQELKKLGLK
jgi:hypothetical protein